MSEAQFAYLFGCGGTALVVLAFAVVLAATMLSSQVSREEEAERNDTA